MAKYEVHLLPTGEVGEHATLKAALVECLLLRNAGWRRDEIDLRDEDGSLNYPF